jgi:hypothetical protein
MRGLGANGSTTRRARSPQENKIAIRVKTHWHTGADDPRGPEEIATVVATNVWKLADLGVTNLSKADYDIITPQRGFNIIAEFIAFMVHMTDRLVYGRLDDADRGALITTMVVRLAEIMEGNIHAILGDTDHAYQQAFIDKINRRIADYSTFEFPNKEPGYVELRYLGNSMREIMEGSDQPWIVDQIREIEVPIMLADLKRTIDGFFPNVEPKAE